MNSITIPNYLKPGIIPTKPGIAFDLQRPFFEPDNGATPWYAEIPMGSPQQAGLRFMIDTGTKNTWVTSDLCTTEACSTHRKFNHAASSTYSKQGDEAGISFGAWGSMEIIPSKDVLYLPGTGQGMEIVFDMASQYNGSQFKELICDGGIGIPANVPVGPNSTLLLNTLTSQGLIGENIASFWYDRSGLKGRAILGGVDLSKMDLDSLNIVRMIQFPSDLECWLINMESMTGVFPDGSSKVMMRNVAMALDTGSSEFKGDNKFVDAARKTITNNGKFPEKISHPSSISDYPYPTLQLVFNGVSYPLTPDRYFVQVSEGEWELAFDYLEDCEDEFLVGTTFLETVCTVFDFDNRWIVLAKPKL